MCGFCLPNCPSLSGSVPAPEHWTQGSMWVAAELSSLTSSRTHTGTPAHPWPSLRVTHTHTYAHTQTHTDTHTFRLRETHIHIQTLRHAQEPAMAKGERIPHTPAGKLFKPPEPAFNKPPHQVRKHCFYFVNQLASLPLDWQLRERSCSFGLAFWRAVCYTMPGYLRDWGQGVS